MEELWRQIVDIVLLVISIAFGGYLAKAKKKIKDAADLMNWLDSSLQDDKVTEEEWNEGFQKLKVLIHDCPGKEPKSQRMLQIKLIIIIVLGVAFLVWYFLFKGW
jgi:uncharacterized protein YoxC